MSRAFNPEWLEGHRVDIAALKRADVVGIGHVLTEIDALAARLREPDRAAAMGLVPPRGILLWGEPGLGKTLCARYLAAALGDGVPFYEVSADEMTPERIRGTLRHLASAHPRSVLYLDEVDTIGMSRDYGGHDRDTRMRLTSLLAALDGLTATNGPVVIASSNRPPYHLDPALVRSGRLGFRVRFDAPSEDERVELLRLFTRSIPVGASLDLDQAARLTRGKTPADLRQIVEDAASMAFAHGRDALGAEDLLAAVRRDGNIEPQPDALHFGETRRRMAAHEAGHVAVCVARRGPGYVYSVRIGVIEGSTSYGDERIPSGMRPDDEIRDSLAVAYGGIAAEKAVFGEATLGGSSDVSGATALALQRLGAGLGERVSPIDLDHLGRNVSEPLKVELASALAVQLEAARAAAEAIVLANAEPIRRFAAVLAEAGELTGDDLRRAIDDAGFIAPADLR